MGQVERDRWENETVVQDQNCSVLWLAAMLVKESDSHDVLSRSLVFLCTLPCIYSVQQMLEQGVLHTLSKPVNNVIIIKFHMKAFNFTCDFCSSVRLVLLISSPALA